MQMKKAVLREDLMKITGDVVQAMVLGQMLYWTKTLDKVNDWLFEENKRLAEADLPQHEYNYGWIWKSAKEMREDLMFAFSEDAIQRAFSSLTQTGLLMKRNNPVLKYDRKLHYRIDLLFLRRKLKESGWEMTDFILDSTPQDAVSIPQGAESMTLCAETITEIKVETSNKETPIVPNGDIGLLFPTEQLSTDSPRIANRSAMASRSNAIPGKTAEFQARANRLLGRRPTTNWSRNEIKAAANCFDTTEEEWKLLEGYYAHRGEKDYYCRTTMITLLNNWASEIDKARSKQAASEQEEWKPRVI